MRVYTRHARYLALINLNLKLKLKQFFPPSNFLWSQGLTSDLWLHVTDWYPTILAMAGLTPESQDLDGINHWAQLQDPTMTGTREEMVYNAFYSPVFNLWDNSPVAAIRSYSIDRKNDKIITFLQAR